MPRLGLGRRAALGATPGRSAPPWPADVDQRQPDRRQRPYPRSGARHAEPAGLQASASETRRPLGLIPELANCADSKPQAALLLLYRLFGPSGWAPAPVSC